MGARSKARKRALDVLFEVEKAVASAEAQPELLDRILAKALEVTGATAGSILLSEVEDRGTLYFRSAKGEKSEVLASMRLTAGQGIAGAIIGKAIYEGALDLRAALEAAG